MLSNSDPDDNRRVNIFEEGSEEGGPVLYWMSRDQRASDNWALIFAQEMAINRSDRLGVAFCLNPGFLGAGARQYSFMLRGLREVKDSLSDLNIPFFLLDGKPQETLPEFCRENDVATIVGDFSPLRIKTQWRDDVRSNIDCGYYEVDAHNIIPCWVSSPKLEYAAHTIRPKIHEALPEFLTEFKAVEEHPHDWTGEEEAIDWEGILEDMEEDGEVPPVNWIDPGEKAGMNQLRDFLSNGLGRYSDMRNDPTAGAQSGLSPYLHFGHLSAQRVALEVEGSEADEESKQGFLEELVVRRELSDNFCHYNPHYDSFEGFHSWAKKTLNEHREDEREYLYSLEEFERGDTHDELWNAAQMEMMKKGKMHGYMRMYWAKKILEWTESPEQALEFAIHLNDKYELDGRDPNGYTGIAWSIGGVHDRAWQERPVYGKVRYMSYSGCKRKFDIEKYMEQVAELPR